MTSPRLHLFGLFAVLLALMATLGAGASVPRMDPMAIGRLLCHADDDKGGAPSRVPDQPADCPSCPLCVALHAMPVAVLTESVVLPSPLAGVVVRDGLPPPSTAPPAPHRSPNQPRAPPIFS